MALTKEELLRDYGIVLNNPHDSPDVSLRVLRASELDQMAQRLAIQQWLPLPPPYPPVPLFLWQQLSPSLLPALPHPSVEQVSALVRKGIVV